MHLLRLLCGLCLLLAALSARGGERVLRFVSADWPPYIGSTLPGQGPIAVALRDAYRSVGVSLVIEFHPWVRSVYLAEHDPGYAGYLVDYDSEAARRQFLFSDVIAISPLGIAERAEQPLVWELVEDLRRYRLGVVRGYVNTAELDALIARGEIAAEAVSHDAKNLLKLAMGRVDGAVIDRNVMASLLAGDPRLAGARDRLRFNPRLLAKQPLYACFRRDPQGADAQRLLAEGMRRVDVRALVERELAGAVVPAPPEALDQQ